MREEKLLKVEELSVHYPTDGGELRALDGVSLSIAMGEILVVVGESGSGKSTLGLSIAGLISRSGGAIAGGTIRYKGQNLAGCDDRDYRLIRGSEVGMIFQNARASLNPVRTIGSQLVETLRSRDKSIGEQEATLRSVALLEMVGIPDPVGRLSAFPHQISGGMCQRVMIALGIALNPSMLIADEPTSALDVTVKVQILRLLKKLNQELGMAIMLITHDLGAARAMGDRVAVMYAGQVVEVGPAADVLRAPDMPYTQALFASLPRISGAKPERLSAIPGRPPGLIDPPKGCRFAARCNYRASGCASPPPMLQISPGRSSRCFYPHDSARRLVRETLEGLV